MLYRLKVWCETEHMYTYNWSENSVPVCVNNSSHMVNDDLSSIEQTIDTSVPLVKLSEFHNSNGNLIVQPTCRPPGTVTCHTGYSDDILNMSDVGNGKIIRVDHMKGGGSNTIITDMHLIEQLYVDFNTVLNPTYIFRAKILHSNFINSNISCYVTNRITPFVHGSGTIYQGIPYLGQSNALILPSNNTGNLQLYGEVSLVETQYLDNGTRGQGFWNAEIDYNEPKLFKNITPAPYGNGKYNIFAKELLFDRFVNIILDSPGKSMVTEIDSFDISRLPHGVRLKIVIKIPKDSDSTCTAFTNIMMYRTKTI